MNIDEEIFSEDLWKEFLLGKQEVSHISKREANNIEEFINNKEFITFGKLIQKGEFPQGFSTKRIINKAGTTKKRVVYSYENKESIVFKFIAYRLHKYDNYFSSGLYSFRKGYGVGNALGRLRYNKTYGEMFCFKADISNYFNSIDVNLLLNKMEFVKKQDEVLYNIFYRMLSEEKVWVDGELIKDKHGAMAGVPVSPFCANVYLSQVDRLFESMGVKYFRYSDDILIFAPTKEELEKYIEIFIKEIENLGLSINREKVTITKPGEKFEFLGFSYDHGEIDLSQNTINKTKAKIKRKASALRRWSRKKELDYEKGAKGLIHTMNEKFYGINGEDEFNWSRWFFPYLTKIEGLKEIDLYMQQYIRYTVTGHHNKGNYKITYEMMKNWGYKNLVNEFYKREKMPTSAI